jgi:ABC-2 type transport system ATP-binding protein
MLVLRDIGKTFADGTEALGGVDLAIESGLFGLLGPNGAGKTTLLSILVLVLEPSRGSRLYDGRGVDSAAARRALRRRIGFLPQHFEPLAGLTGREYLTHCCRLRLARLAARELASRVRDGLAAVDLLAAADRPATTYSGGMRRRLGLAQALIHRPELLVIDEPTAGLDPEERIRFRNLIAEVAVSSTVILSTHIVEDIEATCPRIGVIAAGRMRFDGTPTELLRRLAGRLWLAGADAVPPPGARELGRRADGRGGTAAVVVAPHPFPGAQPREPDLESAYLAFLADGGPP